MTATIDDDFYVDDMELPSNGFAPPTGSYDRYILPGKDGKTKERVRTTTIASGMDDGFGLGTWSLYRAIWGVAQRDDLISLLRSLGVDQLNTDEAKAVLKDVANKAKLIAGTDAASNWGTAAHGVLQRVDNGETKATIHEYWHPLIDNYLAALAREGLEVVPGQIERVCYCARYDIGGRYDNIYREVALGTLVMGDKKTKGDPDDKPRAISMQLGIYANAEMVMNYETRQYEAMLPVRKDYGVIVHIDRDTMAVEILRVNIAHGWECVRVEIERRELRNVKHLVFPYAQGIGAASGHGDSVVHESVPVMIAADRLQAETDPASRPQPPAPPNGQVSQYPCGDCGAPDYINGPHTVQCSQHPSNLAAYEAGRSQTTTQVIQNEIYDRVNQHRPAGAPEVRPGTATAVAPAPTTVGPHPTATAPPTPDNYPPAPATTAPAVDPTTRVQEILAMRKNDKARLQGWLRALGGTDVQHHRKWLAEEIVKRTPSSGAIEPSGEGDIGPGSAAPVSQPPTNQTTGLPPAPTEPPGQPVVGPGTDHPVTAGIHAQPEVSDMTPEAVIRDIQAARSMDVIARIYTQWTTTYGPDSWQGPVKDAADTQANLLRSQPPTPVPAGDDGPPF